RRHDRRPRVMFRVERSTRALPAFGSSAFLAFRPAADQNQRDRRQARHGRMPGRPAWKSWPSEYSIGDCARTQEGRSPGGDRGRAISRGLNGHGEREHADHGYGDQPSQPFPTIEAQQTAIAPNVRGHDTHSLASNRFTQGYSGELNLVL